MSQRRGPLRALCIRAWLPALLLVAMAGAGHAARAAAMDGAATLLPAHVLGGASGYADERDADIYPSIAYDATTNRYLGVWLTARNASSSSSGLDVYGIFLDRNGMPSGNEFRISDSNNAARNAPPTVAAGNGQFAVAWTVRSGSCQVYVQLVTSAASRSDYALTSGTGHHHSPALVYNPARGGYVLAFVHGDDYLPPVLFGVQTADCGNNPSGTGRIKALEFHFGGDRPVTDSGVDVSDGNAGVFRPRLAYSAGLGRYLVAWEDRRNAGGQAYRFDLYARRLGSDLTPLEGDLALAAGGDYRSEDTSATWTPRPAVAGGDSTFLVAWFSRQTAGSAAIWSVEGCLVPGSGSPGAPFTVARMTFAQPHPGRAPTGFLAAAGLSAAQEYLVGMTTHLESVWGYLSSARIQRVSTAGQLLKMDGTPLSSPAVGYSVDYENDDQVGIGLATNPASAANSDYMLAYSKHARNRPAQDYDIWGARIQLPGPALRGIYLPCVGRNWIPQ